MTSSVVAALRQRHGTGVILDDPAVLASYSRDQADWLAGGQPAALARPASTAQIAAILEACAQGKMSVVTRGAGSGLAGRANAADGCLVLSLERKAIRQVDAGNRMAVCEAGVITGDLKAAAAREGLCYPPDPASAAFCTIGGNAATNAAGICCIKYGPTWHWVLDLEIVTPDGQVWHTGRRTLTNSAGFDLTRLLIGSEGTLAVITEVTVRLVPRPPCTGTLVAFLPTLASAGHAVTEIARTSIPSVLEIMDRTTVAAVDEYARMDLDRDAAALVFAQVAEVSPDVMNGRLAQMERTCRDASATYAASTADEDEGSQLLQARRLAYTALERAGRTMLDDVVVPPTAVTALLAAIERISGDTGATIATFGHAGAGNLHPTIVLYRESGPAARASAGCAFDAIVAAALSLGVSISGEHGVGILKAHHLAGDLAPDAARIHRGIRRLFDPAGILNPGKVVS